MVVLIQGMRRSGTTVAFDVLCQDGRFDAWYEPFGPAKSGRRGGGSGLQDVEFSARTRALRERMAGRDGAPDDPSWFNYGAPRDAELELADSWPEPCLGYLREMLSSAPHVCLKFVRAAHKLAQLHALAPEARLLHVVRDPRRVAASQMLSRERVQAGLRADRFFARRDRGGGLWASRALSEVLSRRPAHEHLDDLRDFERILLVWGHLFRRTHDDGRRLFGDRYRLVRHEDLCRDPGAALEEVYAAIGDPVPPAALDWARRNLTAPGPPPLADAVEWSEAFARLGLEDALRSAGYAEASA